jgi:zinc transporter
MSSDESPFVCAFVLDRKGSGIAADEAAVEAWRPDQGLLWAHLDITREPAREWLRRREDVDDVIMDALLAGETRPRSVPTERGQLLVLRGVNMNPGSDPDDMVSIRVWLEQDRILTSRRRRLLSIDAMREEIGSGKGPTTSGGFVVSLLGHLADRIGKVVGDIEDSVDEAEGEAVEPDFLKLRLKLGAIRRQTASIRRYLAPQRDALDRLYRQPSTLFSREEVDEIREAADRITRYLEDLDLARERAMVLQEELLGRLAQEQNARMYLLSVVAAVFLPLSFVTGLLGMNVSGLPGTQTPGAFAYSVLLMGGLGVGLVMFFKWKKWI